MEKENLLLSPLTALLDNSPVKFYSDDIIRRYRMLNMSISVAEVLLYFVGYITIFHSVKKRTTSSEFKAKWCITELEGADIACKIVSALFATCISGFGFCILAFWELETAGRGLLSPSLHHVYLISFSYFIYDIYAMYSVQGSKSTVEFLRSRPLIVIHHLIISFLLIPVLMAFNKHEPGELMIASAMLMEASSPFANLRAILAILNEKKSKLYLINGLIMVIVFFSCRILAYPIFYWKYAQLRGISMSQAYSDTPLHCHVMVNSILLPQLYWWALMIKGAIKVLKKNNNDNNNEEKKSSKKSM